MGGRRQTSMAAEGRTGASTQSIPVRALGALRFRPPGGRRGQRWERKAPGRASRVLARHPNVVFGCQGTRTRRGPVVVCPDSLGIRGIRPQQGDRLNHNYAESLRRADAVHRPLVPMVNPSSSVRPCARRTAPSRALEDTAPTEHSSNLSCPPITNRTSAPNQLFRCVPDKPRRPCQMRAVPGQA